MTDHPVRTAVAVTVFGQPVSVTAGTVVYPVPGVVIVALRSVVRGIVVQVTVADALPVPAGAAIVIPGVVHVPVPPNVIPVTDHPVRTAVAVTVFGQPERVTAGAVV